MWFRSLLLACPLVEGTRSYSTGTIAALAEAAPHSARVALKGDVGEMQIAFSAGRKLRRAVVGGQRQLVDFHLHQVVALLQVLPVMPPAADEIRIPADAGTPVMGKMDLTIPQ